MNYLVLVGEMRGGSPLSIINYIDILIKNENYVYVIGEFKSADIVEMYTSRKNLELINKNAYLTCLRKLDIISMYKTTCFISDFVYEKKIDILFISNGGHSVYFGSMINKKYRKPFVALVAGGDMFVPPMLLNKWHYDKLICFSEENKEYLLNAGKKVQDITVISNRINIGKRTMLSDFHKSRIRLLLASRIDKDKWNSICFVVELVKELKMKGMDVYLVIAGEGKKLSKLIKETAKFRTYIECVGYESNMQKLIEQCDIALGKGRSVIEPIMYGKIGIVLGENQTVSICDDKSMDNLIKYNMAGRNFAFPLNKEKLIKWFEKYEHNEINFEEFIKVSEKINDTYSTEMLEKKFMPIINSIEKKCTCEKQRKQKHFGYLKESIYYIFWSVVYKIIVGKA